MPGCTAVASANYSNSPGDCVSGSLLPDTIIAFDPSLTGSTIARTEGSIAIDGAGTCATEHDSTNDQPPR